ncbi:MAG: thioester domain-containing protein [[Clostridium] scindens]
MKGKRSSKVLLLGALLLCLILGIAGKSSKMTVCAGEASLVQGEAVQYMGYSTHYYYVNGNLAYCLEPDMASPGNGNYPSEEINPAQLLGKAMYYVYGGPGYDAYMKPSLNGGWDQPDRAYCLSHCILSYIYDGCNPQSAGFIGLNEDIRNAVIQFTDAIKGWPQIPSTDISLSDTELTAYFSKEEGWQRTSSVTCNGDGTNSLVFSLPEGITLVNESRNVRETIQCKCPWRRTFLSCCRCNI